MRVEETDERVMSMGTCLTKRGAEKRSRKNPPIIGSYHLRVERRGRFKWEIVAYQNVLVPDEAEAK